MRYSDSNYLVEYLSDEKESLPMKNTILVNHLRSGIMSLFFISHIIEVVFVLFLCIFLLGPAVIFIINGLFCAFLFARPHWFPLVTIYKVIFHLSDDDFYMDEIGLDLWFWLARILMVIIALGQIILGIYFLTQYGFLNQNLIYLIINNWSVNPN
jgi:hypothetical protein